MNNKEYGNHLHYYTIVGDTYNGDYIISCRICYELSSLNNKSLLKTNIVIIGETNE